MLPIDDNLARDMLKTFRSKYVLVPGDPFHKHVASKVMDIVGAVVNRRGLLPPFSMRRMVGEFRWQLMGEDFRIQGNHFAQKLTQDAGLRSDSTVLDLGSGCGRIAIPLIKILESTGTYYGLEPIEAMVKWCGAKVTSAFPNFQFCHCDVYNKVYNPIGTIQPEDFDFPFESRQFDLIVATSVFTHLTTKPLERYVTECSRVLEQGGRLFASFFLLENGARSYDGGINFSYVLEPRVAMTINPSVPEKAIAYSVDWLLSLFGSHHMQLIPPIRWGCWTGRHPAYSGQDILILGKS